MEMNRRSFIGASAAASAAAFAADDKVFDGGLAEVSKPGVPERERPLIPAGSASEDSFSRRCVGCQLCVAACPHHILRPSADPKRCSLPEMGFENGWCRPDCTKCGAACPAGAIVKLTSEEKRNTHIGRASWHKGRCLAAGEGVSCNSCQRHCPVDAITLVPLDKNDKSSPKIPVVDEARCIGCGACEHFCPARPLPAMTIEGYAVHRAVRPMPKTEAKAEASAQIIRGRCTFALVKDGVIVECGRDDDYSSLRALLDRAPDELRGSCLLVGDGCGSVKSIDDPVAFLKASGNC